MSGPEALATEIVGSNPDVIFVVGPGAVFFKKLTSDFAAKKAFIVPGRIFVSFHLRLKEIGLSDVRELI